MRRTNERPNPARSTPRTPPSAPERPPNQAESVGSKETPGWTPRLVAFCKLLETGATDIYLDLPTQQILVVLVDPVFRQNDRKLAQNARKKTKSAK